MSNEIAIELIKEWIKPGYPPLGMQFGWIQPNDNDHITLGDLYCSFSGEYTIQDLLFIDLGYPNYDLELAVSLNTAKQVILESRNMGIKDLRKDKISFDGIYCSENPSIEFGELSEEESILYRLSILVLNTMTNGHNFAVEYLDYLAEYHVGKGSVSWSLYDRGYPDDYEIGNIVELITSDDHFPFNFYDNHRDYDLDYLRNKADLDVITWFNQLEDLYQDNEKDIIMDIFPNYDIYHNYDRKEIISFLSWIVSWLKYEFKTGNLSFQESDDLSPKLNNWIKYINSQLELPIKENTENENTIYW
jgi:hypothetical protein